MPSAPIPYIPMHAEAGKPLVDSFKRRHSYLRLSITDLCNFKCAYCLPQGYQGKQKPAELSLSEIQVLLSAMADLGIKKIRLTGGEPSLRKDLLDIIRLCKRQTGIEQVCITTNGYRLDKFLPQWIEAGIDQVNISVDSLTPSHFKLITSSSDLANIVGAIDKAIANNFTAIKINAVLLREYYLEQSTDLIEWLKETPISLRFIELMETAENSAFFVQQHVPASHIADFIKENNWILIDKKAHSGPAEEYEHSEYLGRLGLIRPYSSVFCGDCNRLRVNAQGQLQLCLYGDSYHDLRHLLLKGKGLALKGFIEEALQSKSDQHGLHQRDLGVTQNFSMIGG